MTERSYGFIPFHNDGVHSKVFLIHQYGSAGDMLWTFPKGRGEEGESPKETAVRELQEETGLVVTYVDENKSVSTSYSFIRRGELVEKISTYFIGVVTDTQFVIQESEVKEAGWFDIEAAREKITFQDQKQLLDTALALLDK